MVGDDQIRIESDLVGALEVPATARYGIHSVRAAANFARPGAQLLRDVPELCTAMGMVKLAAQRANERAGELDDGVGSAIGRAAVELIEDRAGLRDDLIVPLMQGGAGTSINMNVNEVLANRALELLGRARGDYRHCHPNDHVNRSQSTNDVFPTALRVALMLRAQPLDRAARRLEGALRRVAREHDGARKLGRTQLQDAVAMTVGEEFDAWADAVARARRTLLVARDELAEVNLGGTAIGNGLTASDGYRGGVVGLLAAVSGLPVRGAVRGVSATTDSNALSGYSGALRGLALALAKFANDLRLLSSGPRGGLAELRLPPVQGGSSMMPGKINPVIAEFVNQIAFGVRGRDQTVAAALDAAQLQLHPMLPLIAGELLDSQNDLRCALDALRERCIEGIVVDVERAAELARHDLGELSRVAAHDGYALATAAATIDGDAPLLSRAQLLELAPADTDSPKPEKETA
jgi:aspartate ammonia-lyase